MVSEGRSVLSITRATDIFGKKEGWTVTAGDALRGLDSTCASWLVLREKSDDSGLPVAGEKERRKCLLQTAKGTVLHTIAACACNVHFNLSGSLSHSLPSSSFSRYPLIDQLKGRMNSWVCYFVWTWACGVLDGHANLFSPQKRGMIMQKRHNIMLHHLHKWKKKKKFACHMRLWANE